MAAAGFVAELSHAIQQVAETPERWPRYIANKAVYLSRLSLRPYLPSDTKGSHCRRGRAREAKTGVLDIPKRLTVGDTPSNSRLHRTITAGIINK